MALRFLMLACVAITASQVTAPPPAIQERLDRVSADLFSRAEHVKDDVRELKEILAVDPRSAEAHTLLGIAYSTLGSRDLKGEAVAEFRQALERDPTLVQVRFYLAHVYLDLGQRDEAIKELEQVVRSGPPAIDPYLALGNAYVEVGRATDAIETLTNGLRLDPARPELHIALARAYRSKGLLEKADAQLVLATPKRAKTSASSDYPYQQVELDFYLERGMVKLQRGQLAAAAEAFKKVLDLEPHHEVATRELAEVNRRLRAKKPGGGH